VKWRHAAYGAGAALTGFGVVGLVTNAADTRPIGWLIWFAGVALAHDLLLIPLVFGAAILVGRTPSAYRRPIQVTLILSGSVTAVALPLVLGLGRRPDNPSQLPLDYGGNLIAIQALIGLVGAALAALSSACRRRRDR
jgi:hypothetical protein